MKTASYLTVLLVVLVTGCSTPAYKPYPATPVEPQWQQFSRPPIVEVQQVGQIKNFVVSDEFIVKAGQEHDYIHRFKKWKSDNSIP